MPPLLATGIAMYGQKGLAAPGPPAPWSELSSNLGYLLGGSLLAQVLSYAPFLGAQVLAKPDQRALVADFIVGLFLSRIPILLFQAVQAALLPKLSTLVSAGRDDEFQNGVRKLVLIVVGIGVLGVVVGGIDRPVRRAASCSVSKFNLGHADVALLAAGQRALHPGAHVVAGADRAVGPPPGDDRLVHRAGRVPRRDRVRRRHALFLRVEIGSIAGAGVSAAAMGLFFLNRVEPGRRRPAAWRRSSSRSSTGPLEI